MDKTEKIAAIRAAIERRKAKVEKERQDQLTQAARKRMLKTKVQTVRKREKERREYVTMEGATKDDIEKILAMKKSAIAKAKGEFQEAWESYVLASKRYAEAKEAGFTTSEAKKNLKHIVEYLERKFKLHQKLVAKAENKEYRLPKRYVPKYQKVPKDDFIEAQDSENAIGYFSIEQTCISHNMSRQAVSHRIRLGLITPHVIGQYKFISDNEMKEATEEIKRKRSEAASNLKKSVAD